MNIKNLMPGRLLDARRSFSDGRFIFEVSISVAAILFVLFFPGANTTSSFLILIFASYLLFPAISAKLLLKKPLRQYGFQHMQADRPFRMTLLIISVLLASLAATWVLILKTSAGGQYAAQGDAILLRSNFLVFLSSIILSIPTTFANEAFFRGFILWSWRRKIGVWSIPIAAAAPVIIALFRISDWKGDSALIEIAVLAIGSLAAALVAFISESFIVSFCFFLVFDTLSVVLTMARS